MTEPVAPVYLVDDDAVSLGLYAGVLERHGLAGIVACQDSREVLPRPRPAPPRPGDDPGPEHATPFRHRAAAVAPW